MTIAIIDADLIYKSKQRFPNLACMKLSGYYKELGNDVCLLLNYNCVKHFDKVCISKVFTETEVPQEVLEMSHVEYGGTGFYYDKAESLPYEIEHHTPDYHLYDSWVETQLMIGKKRKEFEYYLDYSIGFTTRGCFRQCYFCVNKGYKKVVGHSLVSEFLDENRKYICLLDDNVLGYSKWQDVFDELIVTGKRFQYKQGLDERILTDLKCEYIFKKSKWKGDFIFAFDDIRDGSIIMEKLKLIRKHFPNTKRNIKFYVFCGSKNPQREYENFYLQDVDELFKRIEILGNYGCYPYVMRHEDYLKSPYQGLYKAIASWCNQPSFFKHFSFCDYCIQRGMKQDIYKQYKDDYKKYLEDGYKKYSTWNYMEEFEDKYSWIANKYFYRKMFNDLKNE